MHEAPTSRIGEVWLEAQKDEGTYWLVCDAIMNIEKFPDLLFVRILMKLYGLRIGLDVNRGIARRGFEDRQAFRDWAIERFSQERRSVLIPCHGAIDKGDALNARVIALMKRRFS